MWSRFGNNIICIESRPPIFVCLRDTRGIYSILNLKSKLTISSLKIKSEAKEEYSIVNKVGSEKKKKKKLANPVSWSKSPFCEGELGVLKQVKIISLGALRFSEYMK